MQPKPDRTKGSPPDKIQVVNELLRSRAPSAQPQVGIFWTLNGRLIIASANLADAEIYGICKNYAAGHNTTWERFQRLNLVPVEVEYEEPPRGRVLYNTTDERFRLFADACILNNAAVMEEIRSQLRLPMSTEIGPDEHYRCSKCLGFTGWDDE